MAVKSKAEAQSIAEGNVYPAATYSKFWAVYFIASIGVLGTVRAYVMSVPPYLLGRIWKSREAKFTALGDHLLCKGVQFLLKVQPWLRADIRLNLEPLRLRKQGFLVVSNHRSHLDAFVLLSHVAGIRIFAKSSLFNIPFLGQMMRLSRQIPVAREVASFFKAMDEVRARLRSGSVVHIFPEMTRCEPGLIGTQNFSALPFSIAIQEKVPILPIVFRATDEAWPKNLFGIRFRQPFQAWTLEPIDSSKFKSSEELRSEVRRLINEALAHPPASQTVAR